MRRAANGGLLIEIMGPDGTNKAKILEGKLRDILHEEAKVMRPIIKGEIRLIGLDVTASVMEIARVVHNMEGALLTILR